MLTKKKPHLPKLIAKKTQIRKIKKITSNELRVKFWDTRGNVEEGKTMRCPRKELEERESEVKEQSWLPFFAIALTLWEVEKWQRQVCFKGIISHLVIFC